MTAKERPKPKAGTPDLGGFLELRLFAECFEDAQKARIAMSNRLSSGTVDAAIVGAVVGPLRDSEHKLALAMRRCFRRVAPDLRAWAQDTPGVGEHLLARLLGAIGHPVIATPHHWEGEGDQRHLVDDPPYHRNVAKLWAYCGHGDPNRRRAKGMSASEGAALGSPRAKMLVRLLAESAMKCTGGATPAPKPMLWAPPGADLPVGGDDDAIARTMPRGGSRRRSPYRDTYDEGRLRYADRDGWSLLHQHNAALRLVGKDILRDLWIVAAKGLDA